MKLSATTAANPPAPLSEAAAYYNKATEKKKPRGPMIQVKGNAHAAILISANYVGIWRKACAMVAESARINRMNDAGQPRRLYMNLFDTFFNSQRPEGKVGKYRGLNIRFMQAVRRANYNGENEPLNSFKKSNNL